MDIIEEKNIVKMACLYYEEGLTQAQIAKQVGVSRSLVSKLLLDAREEGIVEITINSKNAYTSMLERKLEKKYGLAAAVIIDSKDLTIEEIEKMTAKAAAYYLNKQMKQAKSVGISWGKAIRRMVDYFPYSNHSALSVVPLIGGMGDDFVNIHSNQLSHDLAKKVRGKSKYLYAPALLANEQLADALKSNQAIESVLNDGLNVDIAVVGIGSPYKRSTMEEIGYLSQEDIEELRSSQIVGDINSRFYNARGEEAACKINRSIIGVNLPAIKQVPQVLTIAADDQRIEAIKVAVENQLVNVLVTTDAIASKLLNDE